MSGLQHQAVRETMIPTPYGDSIEPIIGYYIFNEYIQLTQDVSGGSILIVDILLIISAISSGIAAYYSIVELYVQYSPIL